MGSSRRLAAICAAVGCTVGLASIPVASAKSREGNGRTGDHGACVLGNGSGRIKHVI